MNDRISRWSCLTILAIANLLFWVAVAVVVALVADDRINLGIETFVRERQATWTTWKQLSLQTAGPTTRPSPTLTPGERTAHATARPVTAPPPPTPRPQPTLTIPARIAPSPQPTPTVRGGIASSPQPSPSISPSVTLPGSNPPPRPSSPTPPPTPALLRSPLLLANPSFDNLMGMDAEMNRSAGGRAVQIRYEEEKLNRELASWLADYPDLPYRDLSIQLNRDQVVLRGKVTVLGFQVSAAVTGRLLARDCLLQAEVQSISIAGFLTPGLVRNEIERIILELVSWYPADYPLCLEQIVVEEGRITIYGSRR